MLHFSAISAAGLLIGAIAVRAFSELEDALILHAAIAAWLLGTSVGASLRFFEGLETRVCSAGFFGWMALATMQGVAPMLAQRFDACDFPALKLGLSAGASMAALSTLQQRSGGSPIWLLAYVAYGAVSFCPLGLGTAGCALGAAFGLSQFVAIQTLHRRRENVNLSGSRNKLALRGN